MPPPRPLAGPPPNNRKGGPPRPSRRPPNPPAAPAGGPTTKQQEGSPAVAFTPEQLTTMRQQLELAEDADEATIVAALSEALQEQAEPPQNQHPAQLPAGIVAVE